MGKVEEDEIEVFFQIEYDTNFLELVGVRIWEHNNNFIKIMRYRGGKIWTLSVKFPASCRVCQYQYVLLRDTVGEGEELQVIREEGGFSTYQNYFMISQTTCSSFQYYLTDYEVNENKRKEKQKEQKEEKEEEISREKEERELAKSQKKLEEFRYKKSSHYLRSLSLTLTTPQTNKIYVIDQWRLEFPNQSMFLYSSSFLHLLNRANTSLPNAQTHQHISSNQNTPRHQIHPISSHPLQFSTGEKNKQRMDKVHVIFEIEIPQLKGWEKVCILGNAMELGGWNPDDVLPLTYSFSSSSSSHSNVFLLPFADHSPSPSRYFHSPNYSFHPPPLSSSSPPSKFLNSPNDNIINKFSADNNKNDENNKNNNNKNNEEETQTVPKWRAEIEISKTSFPLEYKFLIRREISNEKSSFSLPLEWEDRSNHSISLQLAPSTNHIVVSHNNFRFISDKIEWKGVGMSVEIFTLRKNGGNFNDLLQLIQWGKKSGFNTYHIHSLYHQFPSAFSSSFSTIPFFPSSKEYITVFGFDPIYLCIDELIRHCNRQYHSNISHHQLDLDYSLKKTKEIITQKIMKAKAIFDQQNDDFFESEKFNQFKENHSHWLPRYSSFLFLYSSLIFPHFHFINKNDNKNDKKNDNNNNGKEVDGDEEKYGFHNFICFLQYHLQRQFANITKYARKNQIMLIVDFPTEIFPLSAESEKEREEDKEFLRRRIRLLETFFDSYFVLSLSSFINSLSLSYSFDYSDYYFREIPKELERHLPLPRLTLPIFALQGIYNNINDDDGEYLRNFDLFSQNFCKEFCTIACDDRSQHLLTFQPIFLSNKLFFFREITKYLQSQNYPLKAIIKSIKLIKTLLKSVLLISHPDRKYVINPDHVDTFSYQLLDGRSKRIFTDFVRNFTAFSWSFSSNDEKFSNRSNNSENEIFHKVRNHLFQSFFNSHLRYNMISGEIDNKSIFEKELLAGFPVFYFRQSDTSDPFFYNPYSALTPAIQYPSVLISKWEELPAADKKKLYREHLNEYYGEWPKLMEPWLCRKIFTNFLNSTTSLVLFNLLDIAYLHNYPKKNEMENNRYSFFLDDLLHNHSSLSGDLYQLIFYSHRL